MKKLIGESPLSTYPRQTSRLSMVHILTGLFQEITEPLYRKHDTPSCGKKTCEILLQSTQLKYIQNNSTNIRATAS